MGIRVGRGTYNVLWIKDYKSVAELPIAKKKDSNGTASLTYNYVLLFRCRHFKWLNSLRCIV